MGAFLGISLWVALATIIPGLVTISSVYLGFEFLRPQVIDCIDGLIFNNDWITASIAITTMVLTQTFGILLEEIIVDKQIFKFTPKEKEIAFTEGIISKDVLKKSYDPYQEYKSLYLLISKLSEHEDSQGHLKRALAQFFLSNNTLVSFTIGIVVGIGLLLWGIFGVPKTFDWHLLINFIIFELMMILFLIVSFKVAHIRFYVIGKALLATRITHIEMKKNECV